MANYESAISNLEQVMQMDAGYQDGQAMLLLAQAYEGNGDQDQANTWYQKILEDYPDTEAAHWPRRRWTRRIREAVIPKAQRQTETEIQKITLPEVQIVKKIRYERKGYAKTCISFSFYLPQEKRAKVYENQ